MFSVMIDDTAGDSLTQQCSQFDCAIKVRDRGKLQNSKRETSWYNVFVATIIEISLAVEW